MITKPKKKLKFSFSKMVEKTIDIKEFEIISQIGKGQFGIVYKVLERSTQNFFAAKVIQNFDSDIDREIKSMMIITNPTIIQFHGLSLNDFFDQNKHTIIMEYAERGSLLNILENVKKGSAPDGYDNTIRQIILIGISYGMMLLSRKKIVHRDIKPDNIILDRDFYPKITDFGLAKKLDLNITNTAVGTPLYMSPEVIDEKDYSEKSDVYAFGILMYQIVTDEEPFSELGKKITSFQLQKKVIEGERPKFHFPIKPFLKNLIEKCWSDNPSNRPTFKEIYYKLAFNQENPINEYNLDNKYYLEDVDLYSIQLYVDYLKANTADHDLASPKVIKMKEKYIDLTKMIESKENSNEIISEILPQIKLLIDEENKIFIDECDVEIIYKEKIRCIVELYKKSLEIRSKIEIPIDNFEETTKLQNHYNIILAEYRNYLSSFNGRYIESINKANEEIQNKRVNEINKLMANIETLKTEEDKQLAASQIKRLQFEKLLFIENKQQEKKEILKKDKSQKAILFKEIAQLKKEIEKARDEYNTLFFNLKKQNKF